MNNTMRRFCGLLILVAMIFPMSACNNTGNEAPAPAETPATATTPAAPGESPEQAEEPAAPIDAQAFTVTDQAGRTVEINGPVEKIVSGGEGGWTPHLRYGGATAAGAAQCGHHEGI